MSSAADHYAAAESLLDIQPADDYARLAVLAEAQVHATLALAAAVKGLRQETRDIGAVIRKPRLVKRDPDLGR